MFKKIFKPKCLILINVLLLFIYNTNAYTQTKPLSERKRKAIASKVLNILAKKKLSHPSGTNGEVVTKSIAGLAFLASGSHDKKGPFKNQISKIVSDIESGLDKLKVRDPKWDQRTWVYAHALIFLAELQAVSSSAKTKTLMQHCIKKIEEFQGTNGGWCHGAWASGPNSLNYTDFTQPTLLCLIGMGYASKLGLKVNKKTIDRGFKYMMDSSGKNGAIGYSPRPGQKGFGAPGRNGGAMMAWLANNRGRDKFLKKIVEYMIEKRSKLELGHGSALLHFMEGAMAHSILGQKEWDTFWKDYSGNMLKRQQGDGSFTPPKGDGIGGQEMDKGDRSTATHILVMLIPDCRLKLLGSLHYPFAKSKNIAVTKSKSYAKQLSKIKSLIKKVENMKEETDRQKESKDKYKLSLYLQSKLVVLEPEDEEKVVSLTEDVVSAFNESKDKVMELINGEDIKAAESGVREEKKRFKAMEASLWYKEASRCLYWQGKVLTMKKKQDEGKKVSERSIKSLVDGLIRESKKLKNPDLQNWLVKKSEGFSI